jgi:adenylate cyclase
MGRGPQRDQRRAMIDDDYVSRDQLRIEERPENRVQVENLSQRTKIFPVGDEPIDIGASRVLTLPLSLMVGNTRVLVEPVEEDALDHESLMTISQPIRGVDVPHLRRALSDLGDAPAPETIAQWLETVLALQRLAAGSAEFYEQTARALVDLVGLDLGLVLLLHHDNWTVAARHSAKASLSMNYSRTLVNHVVKAKRTFYQDLHSMQLQSESIRSIDAAVVSPVFGVQEEVVGVLYGSRSGFSSLTHRIRPLEAQVVQLLAASVGANLARAVATRTRVQFEQFFSPELVRELERNPDLLEGHTQEVTILVSDLRGFTSLSERLGAQITCRLIRDMMERLSDRIVEHGGVIVDYAGDGILAMWNAPVAQNNHAVRACRAALAMQAEMPELNTRWQDVVGGALILGIGLNTGSAQVGNTGSTRKFKYGPHGYTVNLASRVQDATKKLGVPVLITGSTQDQLPDSFITSRVGRTQLPGVSDGVVLYQLTGEKGSIS